jgi:hypothetical protein
MIKWIKELFKNKEVSNIRTAKHPDVAPNVEFAFECNGVKYYRYKKDYDISVGRFKFIDAFLYEVEIRMDLRTLTSYIETIEKHIDGAKGTINLGKAWQIIHAMKTRTKDLGWSPETVKRLASVIFFDDTEDLTTYDMEYGKKKIEFWEKSDKYAFFLTMPISELLGLTNTSEIALRTYIQQAEAVIKDLTLEPENQS